MTNNISQIDYLKSNPEMVFREGKATVHELISGLVTDAITSGVVSLSITKLEDWWIVNGDADWTKKNERNLKEWNDIFDNLIPNNKAGANSSRTEVIVKVFCEGVYLYDSERKVDYKVGVIPSNKLVEFVTQKVGFSLAFKEPKL